jgi:hypothetical protein
VVETTAACLADGLAAVADDLASTAGVGPIEPLGPGWCLIVRAEVERREEWAALLRETGGLAVSSDPLDALDEQGLAWTRELLRPSATTPGTTC